MELPALFKGRRGRNLWALFFAISIAVSTSASPDIGTGSAHADGFTFYAQLYKSFTPASIGRGNTSVMSVTIFNDNSFPLTLSTSPAALADDLASITPSGVTVASNPNPTTDCPGGTAAVIGTTLYLFGGTVPAKQGTTSGSCSVSVQVTSIVLGNHTNMVAANALHATDETGTDTVTNPTSASATLLVNSVQPPSLSKSFNANTVWVGQTSTLRINITNTDLTYPLTNVSLTDTLPADVTIASAPAASQCNGGTVTSTSGSVTLTGGSIPANSTCTVTALVVSIKPGVYIDTIPAGAIHTQQAVTNASPASAPLNVQAIGLSKSFAPASIQSGGVSLSTLSIVLQNPTTSPYTFVRLTDNLPAGLTVDSASSPQCGGAITTTATSVTLTDGVIPAAAVPFVPNSCTITVKVKSTTAANYTNVIPPNSLETYERATNVLAASASLTVYAAGKGMTGSKSFATDPIIVGGTSVLTINLVAPGDTNLSNVSMTDSLPAGVTVAGTPAATTAGCGAATWTPTAGATLLTMTGGSISAGATCVLRVTVTSSTPGTVTNTITPSNISATGADGNPRNLTGNLTDTLTVSGLDVAKSFTPPSVAPEGISTLRIQLTNTNLVALVNVALVSDTLPGITTAGVVLVGSAEPAYRAPVTTCGSASVVLTLPQTITVSGGTIPAKVGAVNGTCTIDVVVRGKGATNTTNTYTNRINAGVVSGTLYGTSTTVLNPLARTANLTVTPISIQVNKHIAPGLVTGGSPAVLSIDLVNPNSVALTGITFTDALPQLGSKGMTVAIPPNINYGSCGGAISIAADRKSFTYSGGSLNANLTCTLKIDVTMNVQNTLTNTIAAGAVTTENGASNVDPTSWSLTNQVGASLTKYFSPNVIPVSGTATMGFVIQDIGNVDLTGMIFTDTLPNGMSVSAGFTASQCGGTLTWDAGTRQFKLTGGALTADSSCTIEVPITVSAAGVYTNTIPRGGLADDEGITNDTPATDTLTALAPPSITKAFANPKSIAAGQVSTLTFTIHNTNAAGRPAFTGLAFTDVFPTNLTLASPPTTPQCGGMVTWDAGTGTLAFSGGTLNANSTCTVVVGATSTVAGTYVNTTGPITSTNSGSGGPSNQDTLTVIGPPLIAKQFMQNPIPPGGTSQLEIRLTNPNSGTALAGVQFTDNLPTGMQVAAPLTYGTSGSCGSPTFAPAAGDTSLSFSTATIAALSTCTIDVTVTASGGTKVNTTGNVSSTNGGMGLTATDSVLVQGGGLQLVKSTTSPGFQSAGDSIPYSYLLTNTGEIDLFAPFIVNDDHGVSADCGGIAMLAANGGSVTCTGTYTVQAGDVTARAVTNVATATAHDASGGGGNIVTSNSTSMTVHLMQLTLIKSTATGGYRVGSVNITYDYILTNTGDVTLTGPGTGGLFTISDDHIPNSTSPAAFTCGAATTLPPGANVTCSKTYAATAADIAAGSVKNKATGHALGGGVPVTSPEQSLTVYAVIGPTAAKTFDPTAIPVGGSSTITITITNPATNQVVLTNVRFTDNLPAGLTFALPPLTAQCGGTVSTTATSISLAGGTLIPQSFCTVTALVTSVTPGNLTNPAFNVTADFAGSGSTLPATLQVIGPATVTKSFTPNIIEVNDTSLLTFSVAAPAANPAALTGLHFTDALPAGVSVASPNGAGTTCPGGVTMTAAGQSIDVSLASLAAGTSCNITLNVVGTAAGSYDNTASAVSSTNGGSGPISNTARLTVNDTADVSITKADSQLALDRNQAVTYTIVVSNSGPSAVTGALVSDVVPSSLTGATWTCAAGLGGSCAASGSGSIQDTVDLAAGASVTYTLTASVSSGTTTSITNTASVVSLSAPDHNPGNNSATDTDHLNLLTIVKGVSPATYSVKAEPISYTYTITNSGTSTLYPPFAVTDDKVTPDCGTLPASLAPNASFNCSVTYNITQADLNAGSITNNVNATGHDEDNDLVTSNTDTRTINAIQTPALQLTKTPTLHSDVVAPSSRSDAGDQISYAFSISNAGNVTLTNVHVTDPRLPSLSCTLAGALDPGDTQSCTASGNVYTLTQADIDAGRVDNTATVNATAPGNRPVSDTDSQTVSLAEAPSLSLVKTIVSGNPYDSAGDVINYSYLLTNTGNVTLSGPAGGVFTVSDDKATVACLGTTLAPTQTTTCSAAYTVIPSDLGNSVTNHATAHARTSFAHTAVDSNPDSQRALGAPVLDITKDDSVQIVAPGATLQYMIHVTNSSLQLASGIQLVDTLPNGTAFISATAGGTFDGATGTVTWPAFDLAAGASIQFQVTVQVADNATLQLAGITQLVNTVDARDDGTHSSGVPVHAQASDTDRIAIVTVKTLTGTEQLGSADPNVLIGEVLDYRVQIDIPQGTIHDLKAIDILDHGLAFVGCAPGTPISSGTLVVANDPCTDPAALTVQAEPTSDTDPASENAGRHITFDFGQVQNAGPATQTLVLNYRAIVLDIGSNVSGVKGLRNSFEWAWEAGTLTGTAIGVNVVEPQLGIDKSVEPTIASLGGFVKFTIHVEHVSSSTAPAYDVVVSDILPPSLGLVTGSLSVVGTAGLPPAVITSDPTHFQVSWASFPLGEQATIMFDAQFVGPSPAQNDASVEWSSIPIDPAPHLQPLSTYNQHSTERRYDPSGSVVNDYRAVASALLETPRHPTTGFAPGIVTQLPAQPEDRLYQDLGSLWLEIPRLGVRLSIVGVPVGPDGEWDLTWLGNQAGYLNDTAYPTHAGNSVLTAHVYMADGSPGPFVNLHLLAWGDQVIVHLGGQRYIYQVRSDVVVSPDDSSAYRHETYPWLTLITCKDYDEATNTYRHRVVVRAVLIKIETPTDSSSHTR